MKKPTMKMDVSVRLVAASDNLLAVASIKFNDCFVVDGFKICCGEHGIFVSMPSTWNGSRYFKVAFPVTAEFREEIITAVLGVYSAAVQKAQDALGGGV